MTSMPHDKTPLDASSDAPLDAVDALFDLRAQIAALREREAELCDEIRTFATENDAQKVTGVARVAVIETRRPSRIDPGKLPPAILNDPYFFADRMETVVLLWPRAMAASATAGDTVAPNAEVMAPEMAGEMTGEMAGVMTDVAMTASVTLAGAVADETAEDATVEMVEEMVGASINDTSSAEAPDLQDDQQDELRDEYELGDDLAPAFADAAPIAVTAEVAPADAAVELTLSAAPIDVDGDDMPVADMTFGETAFADAALDVVAEDDAPCFAETDELADLAATSELDFPSDEIDLPMGEASADAELEMSADDATIDALDDIMEATPDAIASEPALDIADLAMEPAAAEMEMPEMAAPAMDVPELDTVHEEPAAPVAMRTIGVPPEEADPLAAMLEMPPEPVFDATVELAMSEPDLSELSTDISFDPDMTTSELTPALDAAVTTDAGADLSPDFTTVVTDDMENGSHPFVPETFEAPDVSETPEGTVEMDEALPDVVAEAKDDMLDAATKELAAFVSAEDPFGLKQEPLRAASPDMPLIDGIEAAELDTPRDLRPTEHADLMPLAGLQDEEIAQALAEAEEPLEAVTLSDALDLSQSLEAEADRKFANEDFSDAFDASAEFDATAFESSETDTSALEPEEDFKPATTPFASRRITASGDI